MMKTHSEITNKKHVPKNKYQKFLSILRVK